MKAEIITIGDEILNGQIVDTNSAFIASELNTLGIDTRNVVSISDEATAILDALALANSRADFVFITGGLGPTKDDITKHTLCTYFEDELVHDESVLKHVKELFMRVAGRNLNDLNKQQALVPSKATVLHNQFGTAPGMWMKKENTVFVSMPGVPYEMKSLLLDVVIPKINSEFKLPYIINKVLITQGEPESELAVRLDSWENSLPNHISFAYLPNLSMVKLRLTAKGIDKEKLKNEIETYLSTLLPYLNDVFIGYDDVSLETEIGRLLDERGRTLALAESLTGGLIASSITANSGVSSYFRGGVVTYQTQTKTKLLGVSESVIATHSVVSEPVAELMAKGVQRLLASDYAIAVTGNAGPEKGDSDASVGTVFIAIATPTEVIVKECNFGTNRYKVQNKTKTKALSMLKKAILRHEKI